MQSQQSFAKSFSFEFFPPKTNEGEIKLDAVRKELQTLNPSYFSVTYGAGGTTRDRTFDAVKRIQMAAQAPAAPHISCIGSSYDDIRHLLNQYKEIGVTRLVALRGDIPSGMMSAGGDFTYVDELVRFIRQETGGHFTIEIAAYPEMHPQAPSAFFDIEYFKKKVDAGANSALTQYFYNADAYFRFVESIEKLGVSIPVVPGIMPINNCKQLIRFSDACGAEIPRWIRTRLEAYGEDIASLKAFGLDVVSDLCERLLDNGAPGIHFYSMNQVEPCKTIWQNLCLSDR